MINFINHKMGAKPSLMFSFCTSTDKEFTPQNCLFTVNVESISEKEIPNIKSQLTKQCLPDNEIGFFCKELKNFIKSDEIKKYQSSLKSWCINKRSSPSINFIEIIQDDIGIHHGKFWYGTFFIDL